MLARLQHQFEQERKAREKAEREAETEAARKIWEQEVTRKEAEQNVGGSHSFFPRPSSSRSVSSSEDSWDAPAWRQRKNGVPTVGQYELTGCSAESEKMQAMVMADSTRRLRFLFPNEEPATLEKGKRPDAAISTPADPDDSPPLTDACKVQDEEKQPVNIMSAIGRLGGEDSAVEKKKEKNIGTIPLPADPESSTNPGEASKIKDGEKPPVNIASAVEIAVGSTNVSTCSLNLVCYRGGREGCVSRQVQVIKESLCEDQEEFQDLLKEYPNLIQTDEEFLKRLRDEYRFQMCSFLRRYFSLKTLRKIRLLSVSTISQQFLLYHQCSTFSHFTSPVHSK
jgi:hypothetical protein